MLSAFTASAFSTSHLSGEAVDQTYALCRELRSDLTLEGWRDYVRPFIVEQRAGGRDCGIIIAEYRGYIRGLLSYTILEDVTVCTSLNVRDVVVPLLPAGQPAARSLLQALLEIAQSHRCDRINVNLPKSMEWLAREWSDSDGRLFRVPVTCFFAVPPDLSAQKITSRPMRPNLRLVIDNET